MAPSFGSFERTLLASGMATDIAIRYGHETRRLETIVKIFMTVSRCPPMSYIVRLSSTFSYNTPSTYESSQFNRITRLSSAYQMDS